MRPNAPPMLDFQHLQARLTAHLRDPDHVPPPSGIEDRRLKIYRELFYNNIEGFLANAFPVLHTLIEPAHWHAMVRDFFARHRSANPLFHGLAEEFLRYLDDERGTVDGDLPFLRELAHYEWVELALSVAEDQLPPDWLDPKGDLLAAPPVVSPLAWTLAYDYPVHRISPAFLPEAPSPEPTYLTVYRTPQDEVKFTEINPVTARLMALIEAEPLQCGREHLRCIAAEMRAEPAAIISAGHDMLLSLHARGIVLGARRT